MSLLYPPLANSIQKSLGAGLDQGTTSSVTLNNTTNIQNLAGLFIVDRIDTSGAEKDASVREYIKYTGVSGSTLTTLTRGLGGTIDQDHAIGAVVEFISDVVQQQAILDTFLEEHNDDGTHNTTKVVDLTTAQALTHKDLTDATNSFPTRIEKNVRRVISTTDDATSVIDCTLTDDYVLTAVANATEFSITGTPISGQTIMIYFKDAGVAKALTWTGITALGVTLPTTTVAGKWHYVGIKYNLAATAWHALAVGVEA